MSPIERLKLIAELSQLRKTLPEAKGVEKIKEAQRLLEVRALLGAKTAQQKAEEQSAPSEGESRLSTAHFYADAKPKGISRQRLNNRAVDILRQVEADPSKVLTEDEKKSLALFSGYGGGLVDPEGKKGSAFEYYTPKGIAEGIWGALEGLGFKGGKVLDPSAGTGIFGATAPLSCVVDAVELSQYSGRVNQLVNNGPGYQCTISNFEKVAANTPDEIYDAVVTNVPFGDKLDRGTAYVDDPRYQDEPLENYFILRSLEKLRPNGMAAFIVPTRVISGKGGKPESLRHAASLMAEFVGAYRLPTGTFSNADTDTVTDVIFFRKYSSDVLEKIKELAEQNAAVLSEANVMWGPFLDGKYFESAEGKPYVLGEFVAKDPTKFRDTDKVISNAGISDLKEILQTRRLPRSRVNWDLLEAAETAPIVYEEGDTVTQAGVTLVMRDGVWVAMPKDNSDADVSARLNELANPYAAFEAGRDWQEVEDTIEAADNLGLYSQVPQWLRSARTELKPLSADERRKIWPKGVAGLAVRQVIEERRNDQGISFESEYPALTAALKRLGITQADTRKVKGAMSVGMKTARIHYTKKTGVSDFWAGKISAEVAKTDAVTQALDTPEAKFAAYRYANKSEWIPVDQAAAVLGEGVDPFESGEYCISADGKSFTTSANYYVGNYKDFLDRIDAQIEAASDERVKSKLLRQRERADSHLHHLDFSSMTFTLASPLVTAEEKLQFLKTFVSEYAQIEIDDETGKPYVTVRVPNAKTDNEKLLNRFGQYLKNGSVTLGGAELSMSEKSAFKWLRKLISQSNEQFNTWSRANPAVMGRIQAKANNPKNLRFETAESDDIGHIPGMKASLKLHDYQAEFVSKMGREFSGINGFGVGLGKAQPLDAKILTPNGWVRMGDIKVGDLVISRNGLPTRVTAIYPQGKKEIFEVVFSDGSKTRCCDEHLWLTQTENDRKKMAYHRSRGREVFIEGTPKLLKDIRKTLIHGKKQKNHKIPMVHPVEFEKRNFEIDPYVLGAILGDGGLTAKFVSFTNSEEEVVGRVRSFLEERFNTVELKEYNPEKPNEHRIAKKVMDGGPNEFVQALKRLGLMGCRSEQKFVPDEYMFGSIDQRIDLLHGLMDTDGYVSKDGITVQFNSASERLANAVKELVQSLGGIAWLSVKKTPALDSHVVSIRMPAEINPFSLKRKAQRVKPKSKYVPVRYIVAVNSVGEEEAQCIQVDNPEHLYVTDEYIVTHNTFTALAAVQHVQAIGVKKKTLFVVPNSVLSNWRVEASRAYESIDDCLFVGLRFDKNGRPSVKAANYDEDLERIRENRHAKIFMSMEAFERIKLKKETLEEYASYMGSVDESFRGSDSKKKDEQVKAKRQGVLDILGNKTGAAPYLEDLGIDSIVIDEAHFYKNSANVNSFKGAQYLSLSPASKRGLDAQAKTWYIRGQSPLNDGVLLLTATPITNSPLEIYSMMSLAVGPERVNDAACGVRGADAFMETFCQKVSQDAHMVDGTVKAKNVFVGLNNVDCLRNVITGIATIKNAKDVGATVRVPDRDELETAVTLDDKQQAKLKLYKEAYGWAVDTLREVPELERRGSQAAYDAVQGRFNEDMDLIGHPFNLINKMTMVIADPELDERATFYDFAESDRALVDKVVSQFNAKKIKEKRSSGSGPWTDEDAVHQKAVKDEDGESSIIYEVEVRASVISGNRIVVDTMDAKTQTVFEEMAEKAGLDLDVRSSAKISAMLENFKKEMAHPRGMIDDGVKSPIVKQIIFCDILALHNKIKRLLSKRCGIPAGKIAIVTGQINSSVEEIQAVQDGFNSQGEDNRYQVIIANKKAEVGINLQKGTQAIHHLTIGWTPDSLEQRNGRGARQGNKTEKVSIYYYNADGTFDAVKKDMVSHKGEWITNVTTAGGGNRVNIEGGMSNEDMEILINSSGDKDAVEKARAAKAEADRQKRIQETKTRQATNVDTYLKQKQYLEKYTGPEVIAQEQIVAYCQLLQALAKAEKNLKTAESAGKKTDLQKRRYTNLKARADQMNNDLSSALSIMDGDWKVPIDGVIKEVERFRTRVSEEDIRRYLKLRAKITVKEDSALYGDWASSVEQAKAMMEESIKSFAADAKEEGGQPADLMQAVADGRAFVSPNNTVVTVGSFVMNKPNDVLAMVINVRSDDYVFTYIPADAQRFNSKRAYITPPIIVYPGTSGYDECLRRAAKLEDDLVSKNPSADMLFSKTVPEIANYRQTKLLDWHNISSTLLPDPYFSYVITPSEAETGPIKKQLFESQKTIVKDFNDDFFGVEPGTELIDSAPWNYRTNKALSVMIYAKTHQLKLTAAECENFDLYVQTAVRKIPEDDLDDVIRRELVREDRMVRITIGGYIRSRLDEFIDVSGVDDLALYDFLGVSQKRAIQFAINMITPVEPEEDEPEEETPEEETPREERDDDTLAITGNTYPWKNQIKEAAQSVGEKAKWSRMLTCWLISRKAWKALIKASPAAANELFAKTA